MTRRRRARGSRPGGARGRSTDTALTLAPMVEEVRQESLDELERTLLALCGEYETGDAARRKTVRRVVITARRHAELAARNGRVAEEKRALKREVSLWLLTWLENPAVFAMWAGIRKGLLRTV